MITQTQSTQASVCAVVRLLKRKDLEKKETEQATVSNSNASRNN